MKFIEKIIEEYFKKSMLPAIIIFLLDGFIVFVSFCFVITVQFGWGIPAEHPMRLLMTALFYSLPFLVGFVCMKTYSGMMRYSSFRDMSRLIAAGAIGCILSALLHYFVRAHWWLIDIRLITILFATILIVIMMLMLRMIVRGVYVSLSTIKGTHRAFIYGVKDGCLDLASALMINNGKEKIGIYGFFTDDKQMVGKVLLGNRVYARDNKLIPLMVKLRIDWVIVSFYEEDHMRRHPEFIDALMKAGIKLMVLSQVSEIGLASASLLKEIQIEDLLEREPIMIDNQLVGTIIEGHCVMVTGAAGSIGSEIVRQLIQFNPSGLLLVDQAETPLHDLRLELRDKWPNVNALTIVANITNESRMEELFRDYNPFYVFHAAAYKHVPMMENNVSESVQNNIKGTMILSKLAVKYEVNKFVMISTDKAVNPTNVMGCSKRLCEIYVQSLDHYERTTGKGNTKFITTRFGNVLGSNGSVIPLFKKQIAAGGPITVTHKDIVRYFMTIPEACSLVLEAGAFGEGGVIYEFDMGKPVKIADLAKRMILLSGAKNVKIEYVGLRDGEKLYEELLNDKETSLPTKNKSIRAAKVREYDYLQVSSEFDALLQLSNTFNEMEIVKAMKKIVPEYVSLNSRFNCLDGS